MMRIILSILFVGINFLIVECTNAAEAQDACAVLSEKEAVALTGGPLGTVIKNETKPTDENGSDHSTSCGYLPKGYDFTKADGPPERGLTITLHSMPNKEAAKRFYDSTFEMAKMSISSNPSARIAPMSGLGEAAYLQVVKIGSNGSVELANVGFLKGSVMGLMQLWLKRPPGETAQSAAKQIISKLP
jgi:hypothetical protein